MWADCVDCVTYMGCLSARSQACICTINELRRSAFGGQIAEHHETGWKSFACGFCCEYKNLSLRPKLQRSTCRVPRGLILQSLPRPVMQQMSTACRCRKFIKLLCKLLKMMQGAAQQQLRGTLTYPLLWLLILCLAQLAEMRKAVLLWG